MSKTTILSIRNTCLLSSLLLKYDVKTIRILTPYIRVVVISGGLLLLVMRLGGCASHKNALVKKHAPKRVGHGSRNNGASWPDGDPQSLRDSV